MGCFTHDSTAKLQKFVLKGLPNYPTNPDAINLKLTELNLVPKDIKQMTIKTPTFQNQANYIIYFENGTAHLNDLKKIKSINNVAVSWQHYRSPKGPTQCHQCQMFGHGSRNCALYHQDAFNVEVTIVPTYVLLIVTQITTNILNVPIVTKNMQQIIPVVHHGLNILISDNANRLNRKFNEITPPVFLLTVTQRFGHHRLHSI